MGGRVYDPIAGRFTTADPILQAPFSSQGQNRYAYVFNDPINMTDPSGFAWQDTGSTGGNVAWGIGAAAWGSAAVYAASSASGFSLSGLFTGGSGPSAAAGAVGLGANVLQTVTGHPFGKSPDARFTAPAPSAVSNSSPVKPGAADAVGLGDRRGRCSPSRPRRSRARTWVSRTSALPR
jgi:hypothetical protein